MYASIIQKLLFAVTALFAFVACKSDMTYAELREKETKQITAFLQKGCTIRSLDTSYDWVKVNPNIEVISETQFFAQDSTTDLSKNQYVLFSGSGVYMQIIRKGTGEKLKSGERATIISRFVEFNIASDALILSNIGWQFEQWPELMTITNNSGTLTGSFLSGMMKRTYSSASIPSAWLQALLFVNVGRQTTSNEEIAKVRLIVPSTEGQSDAYKKTYPCFYELTFQRGR